MIAVSTEWLKEIETLNSVPDEQLQWWIDNSEHYIVPQDEYLFKENEPIDKTLLIVSGNFKMSLMQNGSLRELGEFHPHSITGYLPFSRGKLTFASAIALQDAQVMCLPIEKMSHVIQHLFELTQALVHVMTDRVRDGMAFQQQNEKMMALGKLSAGLAHELNNPASAIVRSSILLKEHLLLQPESFKKVISIKSTPEKVSNMVERMFSVMSKKELPKLTLIERNHKEDKLSDWLDEHEVENAMEIAEHFVDYGFEIEDLEYILLQAPMPYLSPVLNWINNNLVTEKMVTEIQEASERIANLVGSVKNFTHMDRAQDKQFGDIHFGIRNTLTMLNHKIKSGNVKVIENYDETLPPVKAFIGELNQVWTNLIDNALDAMETTENKTLEIKTIKDKEFVKVLVIDNGPGISDEVKAKIFDPFFTTKEIGKGTGLGLDVVTRIVKQHNGSIKVNSVPGRTEFEVCFPING